MKRKQKMSRCATCDGWYNDNDVEAVKEHQHPEPQSGHARDAWLESRLDYKKWSETTPEGKRWIDSQYAKLGPRQLDEIADDQ